MASVLSGLAQVAVDSVLKVRRGLFEKFQPGGSFDPVHAGSYAREFFEQVGKDYISGSVGEIGDLLLGHGISPFSRAAPSGP